MLIALVGRLAGHVSNQPGCWAGHHVLMMDGWCSSQWQQTGLQPGCEQTCGINTAQVGVNMAKVQTVIVTVDMDVNIESFRFVGQVSLV